MKKNLADMQRMLKDFGGELAAQRKKLGLTQGGLAERTGLAVNTIGNVERGALDPTVTVVALMQVHLGGLGLEISGDRCIPLASPAPAGPLPFPNLARPPADIAVTVGNAVRDRRLKQGLTMEELAADSDVHLNTLWNVEHGLVAPTISTLYRIYRSLGVRRVVGTPSGIELLP